MLKLPTLGALKNLSVLSSSQRLPGWLCINLWPDRVDISHVVATGKSRPQIALCNSYLKNGNDVATLGLLREELQLDRYRCTTLLKGGDYQMVHLEISANLPAQEAMTAARRRLNDLVDYPVEAATVDAVFIPAVDGAIHHTPQVLAVVAKNETIAAYLKPFHDADIRIEVIDIPELAQRNLARQLEMEGRGLALLAFDERGWLLTFTCWGELYQSCRLEFSLNSFEGASPEQRKGIYDHLVLELRRSLDSFDRQFHHVKVAKLIVTPVPGADNLTDHLAANLEMPVTQIYFSEIMDFPHIPELHEDARQSQCLHLIGAALRQEDAT